MRKSLLSKKILILAVDENEARKQFVKTLKGNFINKNTKIELGSLFDLSFIFGENQMSVKLKDIDITEYDLVYIRKAGTKNTLLANCLGICLKHLKVPFYDSVFGEYGSKGNKLRSLLQLCVSGIPIPKTIYFCKTGIYGNYDHIAKNLGVPFIAKDIGLQRGKGIFLINSREDMQKLPHIEDNKNKSIYLFQKLIEKKHEYRTVIMGEAVGIWYEKIQDNKAEFRYNTAVGAKEVFLNQDKTPLSISKPALKAAKALKIEIAGVDIVVEKRTDKIFILEVNRGPGLSIYKTISPEYKALAEFFEM